jgi:antitoxin YefM
MISGIKQQSTVGKNGKIEIPSTDLPEGTLVEVIVLVEFSAIDETHSLLSTPANKDHLVHAIEGIKNPDNLIVITPNEWNEKYRI